VGETSETEFNFSVHPEFEGKKRVCIHLSNNSYGLKSAENLIHAYVDHAANTNAMHT